ncbi:VQ motif containing protein [Parasponia andersonii]|uniref:VQ motif containing protein n=1 Tax=Parasponia andersonii TaxID=3476 RepID=A0A2P5DZA5_PARAD|nr:VQ motif containing protein [Parasponia andersonii]
MSPARFVNDNHDQDHDHSTINHVINGPRPSPLKINRESHSIQRQKHHSSTTIGAAAVPGKEQMRQPVIIYTHSPKIIHTQARDFMALVQKLTGQSRSDDYDDNNNNDIEDQALHDHDLRRGTVGLDQHAKSVISQEDNESSSVVTTEDNSSGFGYNDVAKPRLSPASAAAVNVSITTPYFADIPLFTPTAAADFFCSPRPVYRFPADTTTSSPSSSLLSPSVGGLLSPSFLEFMKGLPEY